MGRLRHILRLRLAILTAVLVACAGAGCVTFAVFTGSATNAGNTFTVDRLGNHFAVTPGTSVQPGTTTPVASGDVDTLSLALGSADPVTIYTDAFTVKNVAATSQTAQLSTGGLPAQVASAVFASSGATTATLAPGASTSVRITTSATVAGHATGTLRLGLQGRSFPVRDYALTVDARPAAPSGLTATARPGGAIDLSWAASATTTNLAGYDVLRSAAPGGPYTRLNTSGPVTATTYHDTGLSDGQSYYYVVRALSTGSPALSSQSSPEAGARSDATAPTAPTAVALANGGGTGNAFIDAANAGSVSVQVTLPSTSSSGDTVAVTLSDGTRTTTARTVSAPSGPGTVTVTGIDASALADGAVTLSATSTDAAGNVSGARTATVTKDTVAPSAPTAVALTNGLGAGGAYINGSNRSSVSVGVTLPSSSASTDTVTLTASDTASHTVTASRPGTSGAGTVSFTGLDLSALADGAVSLSARVSDAAGNTPATTTVSVTKDTVAPAAPTSVALANGGGTGNAYINAANAAAVSASVGLGSASVTADTVTVTITDGTHTTTARTTAASAGTGTVTVTGIDSTVLSEGSVTLRAASTDVAGNASSAVTRAATKDTVAPAAASGLAYVDANGNSPDHVTGSSEAGSALSLQRTAPTTGNVIAATGGPGFTVTVDTNNGSNKSPLTVTYSVTVTDAAGNASGAATVTGTDTN